MNKTKAEASNRKINGGWAAVLVGWILSSIVFPFLPEIMETVIDSYPFSFPFMEYAATIGILSVLFLFVWIPAGFKASRIYKEKGLKSAMKYVFVVFLIVLFILSIVFRFLWNS